MDTVVIWWYSWGVLLFLFLVILLLAWLVYESQAREVRALGWLLVAGLAALLMLPSLFFKFSSVTAQISMAGQIQPFFYLALVGGVASLIVSAAGLVALSQVRQPAPPPPPPPPSPLPPSRPLANAWLVDRTNKRNYQLISGDTRLGRDLNSDIALDDPSTSREHLLIREEGNTFTLYDRGSRSGTLVNGQRITGPCLLHHGDVITVGDTELDFVAGKQAGYEV